MEIYTPFPQFLKDIAVLSSSQVDKLVQSLTTKDESKTISNLADFFGSLTASDCYDFALRLHSLWKKSTQISPEKQEGAQKLTNFVSKKLKHKGLSNLISASSQPQSATSAKAVSFYASEGEIVSKPTKKYNSFIGNSIFNSLHSESQRKQYIHMENEHKRITNETKDCTFQPQLVASRPASTPIDVFERLQQDLRKEKESINETIKIGNEIKECTFTPRINPKRLLSEESQEGSRIGPYQTFDRLYKQYQIKRHMSIDNELKRQSMELNGCTFQPTVSTTRNGSVEMDTTERYNKLYNLHSERQRSLMKKRMEKLEEEDEMCSFTPQVLPSSAKKLNNKDVHERLREWNELKNVKAEMRLQEKKQTEEKRGLYLPAKKKNDVIAPPDNSARFNKLYKDNQDKKERKEKLEKRIMKNIGASFTPKINPTTTRLSCGGSATKDGIGLGYLLEMPNSAASISSYDERFLSSRRSSPVYKSSAKKAQEEENRTQLKKQFLNNMQRSLPGAGFGIQLKAAGQR